MAVTRPILRALGLLLLIVTAARAADPAEPYPFTVAVRGEGRPMILIPGLACSGAVWDDTVKHFEKQYRCHVLTLAGFAGVPPLKKDGPYLETIRDGILRYVREQKLDKPVIVGHSIGGFLAYDLGIAGGDQVGPLVSVDGLPFLAAAINEAATEEQMKKSMPAFAERMAGLPREDFLKNQQRTVAGWIDDPAKQDLVRKWGADSDQKTVATAMAELFSRDLRPKLATIKAPVLLVAAPQKVGTVSREDSEKRYRKQVESIPSVKVAVAAKAKHFVMFDEPEWMWKEMEAFLANAK